jgi:hypothetical protein
VWALPTSLSEETPSVDAASTTTPQKRMSERKARYAGQVSERQQRNEAKKAARNDPRNYRLVERHGTNAVVSGPEGVSPWRCSVTRIAARCVLSGVEIKAGEHCWRPYGNNAPNHWRVSTDVWPLVSAEGPRPHGQTPVTGAAAHATPLQFKDYAGHNSAYVDGPDGVTVWVCGVARSDSTCLVSGRRISIGEFCWRPRNALTVGDALARVSIWVWSPPAGLEALP